MPETFTSNLGITLPADGENDGTWGAVVNENMQILDRAINGSVTLTLSGTTSSITTSEGDLSLGQYMLLVLGGTLSGTHTITIEPNDAQKIYLVRNTTTQSVVFTQGSGGNVTIAAGTTAIISSDGGGAGAAVVNISNSFSFGAVSITGGTINNTAIGGTTPAAGNFTTVDATALEVTTLRAKDGTAAGSIADSTGVVTLASSVLTTTDINGGTIDGTVIGGSSAAAGNFTTVDATALEVTTLRAKDGTAAGSIADSTGVVTLASSVLTTTDINGGTIDGAVIGGAVAAAGTFTTVNATTVNATTLDATNLEVTTLRAKDGTAAGSIADSTGVVTLASSVLTTTDINGGTIDGAVIGGSFAAAGNFTTVTASGDVTIADKIVHSGDTNTAIRFPAADTVTVETSGAEAMRIASSGYVGIGTTNPNYNLHINSTFGSAQIQFTYGASGSGISDGFFVGSGTAGGFIREAENLPLTFSTNNTERMTLSSSGNLGIGTNSPSAKLHVVGTSLLQGTVEVSSQLAAGSNGLGSATNPSFANTVGGQTGMFFPGGALAFSQGGTEYMRIASGTGYVGIGTTTPIAPLHVAGASVITGVSYINQPTQTTVASATTLTISNLLTGIIQYTGTAATLTLPLGTDIEGGLPSSLPTGVAFDFSVINTGSGTATLGTATGLTLTGSMAVAATSSGRFRVRKTATNTYTIYRIS